jgi:O-antigen/teichoic acid export membrane protein
MPADTHRVNTEKPAHLELIGERIRAGVAWKAISQITLQVSRMAVALVLARLLAPHDWGIAAMVLVFSGFVVVFTDSALGTALIQRRDLDEDDKCTVFWCSVGIGVVLAVTGVVFAGALAHFYREPEIRALFAALSIGFFVTALGSTHMALLVREMEFRKLELRQIAATLVGATTGITIALKGFGPWAIVGQQLGEAVTSTVLLWVLTPWRPAAKISFASLSKLGGFAGNVFGENLLYQAGRNLGSLLMGRFLGPSAVGAYALATNVILVPFSRLAGPLQQVFFPAFARMSDDPEQMATVWIRATRLVGLVSIPSLVGVALVAPDFVDVVLGNRWDRTATVIQILACVGIIQSLQTLNGEVLLALNRAGTLFRFTIVWFAATVGAFALGIQWGVFGVATSFAVATLVVEPLRTYLTARALGISPWAVVRSLGGVAQATAALAVAVVAAREALLAIGVPTGARLACVVLIGAAAFAAGCLWRAPEVTSEIRTALRRPKTPVATRIETVEVHP